MKSKTQSILKPVIAAAIATCFAFNVQAANVHLSADTGKMSKMKMDKKMSKKKMSKMSKMKKDTMSKM
jgi:hypothetical protein